MNAENIRNIIGLAETKFKERLNEMPEEKRETQILVVTVYLRGSEAKISGGFEECNNNFLRLKSGYETKFIPLDEIQALIFCIK